jgi:hypothetical protein
MKPGIRKQRNLTMNLKGLQKVIEKIGRELPPGDDWMPALILESEKAVNIFGFVGEPLVNTQAKDQCAEQIADLISKFKPDCACFVTTAWSVSSDKKGKGGLSELEVELWRMGAMKLSEHPRRVEIVNAYCYGIRGPNKGEALMIGHIQRFPDKGPRIKKWIIMDDETNAQGRFPDAIKKGFELAKGG